MGMYDSIYFKCPNCGNKMDAQSKSGSCCLETHSPDKVPIEVAHDANRHAPFECEKCKKRWYFDLSILETITTTINLPIKEYKGE